MEERIGDGYSLNAPVQMPILDDPPDILYKYFPTRDYVGDVIRGKSIQFTNPLRFNDPFECRFQIEYQGTLSDIERHFRGSAKRNMPGASRSEHQQAAKRIALKLFNGPIYVHDMPSYQELMSQWGILSLTERNESILMWSHYAEEHKGICIGFDGRKDIFRLAHRVEYAAEMPSCNFLALDDDGARRVMQASILSKSEEWEYEKEWRVFKNTRSPTEIGAIIADAMEAGFDAESRRVLAAQDGPGLYHFDPTAVVEVIFGLRTEPEWEGKVRAWIESAGCSPEIYRAEYVRGQYKLKRERI